MMNFSEYALFLKECISIDAKSDRFFVALVENFIEEEAFKNLELEQSPYTLSCYINGKRNIPHKLAVYLQTNYDMDRFVSWIDKRLFESNAYTKVYNWLVENGIENHNVATACANLLKEIIDELASKCIRNSKQEKSACTAQSNNNSEYAKFINEAKLPSELDKKENIFSFRSNKIGFQGRKDELEKLNKWLIQGHVSVWAITGQGGSGKSRLALQFATQVEDDTEKESIGKAVWIDNEVLDKLLTFNDFSYPKPVLFICDYAANYDEKLSRVVDKTSRAQANAKFLLIERSDFWYSGFLQKNVVVNEFAVKEPIILDALDFTSEEYSSIMQDFSDALYGKGEKKIANEAQNQIIKKAKELSGNEHSARCLFLLLVTEAYLKDSDISHLSAQKLLHNYFDHSRRILSQQYEDGILEAGYRILAYATAYGGISFSDIRNHQAVQNEWDKINEQLNNDRPNINQFFQRISEIDAKDTVPAMKPDLIGEFLFLHEWNKLMYRQNDWVFDLLKQDYSRSFFAMCLSDWKEESKELSDLLSDQNADTEKRVACVIVFNRAVHRAYSEAEAKEYAAKIKALDNECSAAILKEYVDTIYFICENGSDSIKSECKDWFNDIDWEHYIYGTTEEQLYYADACFYAANILNLIGKIYDASEYQRIALAISKNLNKIDDHTTSNMYVAIARVYHLLYDYKKAEEFCDKAQACIEKEFGKEHPYTATLYTYIAEIWNNYDTALKYYKKALVCCKKVFGIHPYTAKVYERIASIYHKIGKSKRNNKKALKYYYKALEIRELLGTDNLDTAELYNDIGSIYCDIDKYNKALECHFKALSILKGAYSTNYSKISFTYSDISLTYYFMRNYDKAEEYQKKSDESWEHYELSKQSGKLE